MPSPIPLCPRWVDSLVGRRIPAGHLSPATTAFPRTQMGRRPRHNLSGPHRRFTCVTACLLAGPPSGPLRRRLRRLGDLRRRSDCYRLERPSCRTGVAPAEDSVLFTAHYVPFFVSCVPFFVFPRFGSRRADPGERSSESGVRRAEFGGRSSEGGVRRAEFGERSSESGVRRANSGERSSESGSRRAEPALRTPNGPEPSSPQDLPHRESGISQVPSRSFTDAQRGLSRKAISEVERSRACR